MKSAREKAELCRTLHAGVEPVLSAACWDVGTARLLEHVGIPLLDTTSFGAMAARGLADAVDSCSTMASHRGGRRCSGAGGSGE